MNPKKEFDENDVVNDIDEIVCLDEERDAS